MARLIAFKPRGVNETRTHTAALLILNGGYRLSEILDLPFENCDFDNVSIKVRGKGQQASTGTAFPGNAEDAIPLWSQAFRAGRSLTSVTITQRYLQVFR